MDTGLLNPQRFVQQENKRLQQENETLKQEVQMLRDVLNAFRELHEVSLKIDPDVDVFTLLDKILQAALRTIGGANGSLLLVDEDSKQLGFAVVRGAISEDLIGHRIPLGTGVAGWVAKHGKPLLVPNARVDPRFSSTIDKEFGFQTQSLLCTPILHDGQVMGVLQAVNTISGEPFNQGDLMLLGVVAQLTGDSLFKAESVMKEKKE